MATAPMPDTMRPTAMPPAVPAQKLTSAPSAISASPAPSTSRSPKRRPSNPSGSATNTPGSM